MIKPQDPSLPEVAPSDGAPRKLPILAIVIAAVLCGLLAYVCAALTRTAGPVTAVWLPNALLVAILGRRGHDPVAAWVVRAALAMLTANLLAGDSWEQAAGLACANAIEIFVCVLVLRRTGSAQPDLGSLPDLARFCLIGGVIAPACSALFATLILEPTSLSEALWTFFTWSLTNGLGMILLAPMLWIFREAWLTRSRPSSQTLHEWALLFILGATLTVSVFSQSRLPWLFLVVPVVFIHAFRHGLLGTAFSIIKISIIASIATLAGSGPVHFIHAGLAMQLFTLQLFLATSFAMGVTVAVILDDRKRAIADLTDARDLHQSMFQNMQEIIFRADAEGRWEFLNPAWEQLTGHSVQQSLGLKARDFLAPDDLAASTDHYRAFAAGETDNLILVQHLMTAQGDVRTVELNARALRDAEGQLIGTVGNIRDITVQHRAEQALIQSKREFETLAAIAPVGIVRFASDGTVLYRNPTWLRLAGLSEEEARGEGWVNALHVDDRERVKVGWRAAIDVGSGYRTEFRFVTTTAVIWVDVIAEREVGPDGELKGFVAVLIDITERKALEESLIGARRLAEDAAVAKSAFLANMSHEIRTPMNGVLGFAELLLESPLDDEPRRFARMIVESGREMMRLLNDILDLSKVEAGQLTIISEPTNLADLLRRCIRLMSANAGSKGVELTLEVSPELPAAIMGDGQRIRQVALNLIGNALKFTDHGKVTVRARSVRGADDAPLLHIEIEDSGIGISPEQQKLIFEPFAQGDSSTARRYGGSGLGLTICRQLAHGMNGKLTLDSEPGRGSIFCFAMPLVEPPSGSVDVQAGRPRPMSAPPSKPGRPLHILLAEDLDINQQLVTAILTRAGHRVTVANDGAEAIEQVDRAAAAAWMFDVILMDIQMPKIDGFAATRAIRSRGHSPAELPIIALTANAFPEEIADCLKAGMQAHLGKPISFPALDAALLQWGDSAAAAAALTPTAVADARLVIDPQLRDLYIVRKADVLAHVGAMVGARRYDDDAATALAAELHKLAGTAGMFGEPELGVLAARLERQLLEWNAEERQLRVADVAEQLQTVSPRSA